GVATINASLTQAALPPSSSQTRTISNSPMLLAQSVDQDEILAAHNKYRREVGVPPLKWSDSLASSAQKWAEHLASIETLEHSSANYGENLWAGSPGLFSQTQMVDDWGSEKDSFIPDSTFPDTCRGGWQNCAHYTQLIWRSTKEVGCGLARKEDTNYLVCQYNPPGNIQGERPD
ncbi:MAG: CAP domain-containing protein, partial [Coleofasciculus sp. S288]|nr:CAP domain-containing protein [Coleofasciculus sp. S288]